MFQVSIWSDATGHAALWNGSELSDGGEHDYTNVSSGVYFGPSSEKTGYVVGYFGDPRCVVGAFADEPEIHKTWKFQGKRGAVEIELTRFVNSDGKKATSLHISSVNGGPRSVTEEAEFLAKVLDDLPSTGMNAQSLDWISFRSTSQRLS